MKRLSVVFSLLLSLIIFAGCSGAGEKAANNDSTDVASNRMINVKGSDTMAFLSETLAERFMEKNQGFRIAVVGGGSGTGIRALIDGTADIANASRKMLPAEVTEAETKGIKPQEYQIALDGVAVVVSSNIQLKSLSVPQLKDIFTGKVTNWKEVGGSDAPISVVCRESNSGTYLYFKEHVLQDEPYTGNVIPAPTSPGIGDEVAKRNNAIGYLGVADAHRNSKVRIVGISTDNSSAPVLPSIKTVKDGTYPISRPLQVYVANEPVGQIKDFIDFKLSPEGQKIVEELGYIPLK
ncbi:MAG: PstS family phosphate ABC transporter substrate-binding protein [Eubacteriales bacterium]